MKKRFYRFALLLIVFYCCSAFVALDFDPCHWQMFEEEMGRTSFLSIIGSILYFSKEPIEL